jgi:hypothetical protein
MALAAGRLIGLLYLLLLLFAGVMVIFPFVFSFTAGLHNSIDVVKPYPFKRPNSRTGKIIWTPGSVLSWADCLL